jgi:hypothetical protein
MNQDAPSCEKCTGCTARHTEEKALEEAKAGPYLLFAAVMVVIVSVLLKWLF